MSTQSLLQRLHDMVLKWRNISYNIQEIQQEIVKIPRGWDVHEDIVRIGMLSG